MGHQSLDQNENHLFAPAQFTTYNNEMKDLESILGQNRPQSKYSLSEHNDLLSASKKTSESRFFQPPSSTRDSDIDSIDGTNEIFGNGFSDDLKTEIKKFFGHDFSVKPKIQKPMRVVVHRHKRKSAKKAMILSKKKTRSDQAYEAEIMGERLLDWARTYIRERGEFSSFNTKQGWNDCFCL